jgi:putative redox protein
MPSERFATVRLEQGMAFRATSGSGHEVRMDGPLDGSPPTAASPVELVLIALGGCTGMDVVSILRKMREDVTGYRIEVRGVRADDHPQVYTEIEVVHHLEGRALRASAVERAVGLSAEKYCPVGAMLAPAVRITHRFELTEAPPEPSS